MVDMKISGLILCVLTQSVLASTTHFSIIKYDDASQLLLTNLIAPMGQGQLYLQADGILIKLERFSRVGEHQLRVHLPCDEFDVTDSLFYRIDDVTLTLSLASIACPPTQRGGGSSDYLSEWAVCHRPKRFDVMASRYAIKRAKWLYCVSEYVCHFSAESRKFYR
jgi:hypothetical protein